MSLQTTRSQHIHARFLLLFGRSGLRRDEPAWVASLVRRWNVMIGEDRKRACGVPVRVGPHQTDFLIARRHLLMTVDERREADKLFCRFASTEHHACFFPGSNTDIPQKFKVPDRHFIAQRLPTDICALVVQGFSGVERIYNPFHVSEPRRHDSRIYRGTHAYPYAFV